MSQVSFMERVPTITQQQCMHNVGIRCLFVFKQEMVLKVSIIACCLLFICRGQRRPCSHPGGGEINHGCPGGWLFNPSTEETIAEWAGDGGCRWWFSCSCLLSQLLSCATSPEGFWRVKIFF